MTKYIFVTGGVVSGLGKGITAASLGMMLKAKGLKVIAQKLDPYLNIAPSAMSPSQHGEVFVTEDGAETDLDLGHYERFIDVNLNTFSSLTSGKVYSNVLANDRNGLYHGDTVQVIPHVTNEIKKFIYAVGKKGDADVVISEIGGTTGDIESLPHIEAIRQISNEVGRENCCFVHVTLAPVIRQSGEIKSKPTQHSVKEMRSLGIYPNVIVLRCDRALDESTRTKIAMFCNVAPDCVIENRDVGLLYEVPMMLEKSNFTAIVTRELGLPETLPDTREWEKMLVKAFNRKKELRIGLVGNYVKLYDAYLSVSEALTHAGIENGAKIQIKWINPETESFKDSVDDILADLDGVVIPGCFGERGNEGMLRTAKYCREHKIPYFGIGLGMQIAVIEFARNIAGLTDANSREFNPAPPYTLFDIPENSGGAVRLGAYECAVEKGTKLYKAYKTESVVERHRSRYELNNEFLSALTAHGLTVGAYSPDKNLVEAVELPGEPFYVGVAYRPEFKSRPHKPHPLFVDFIAACIKNKK